MKELSKSTKREVIFHNNTQTKKVELLGVHVVLFPCSLHAFLKDSACESDFIDLD